jgi:DNA polymerase III sliding clamp (beta) subunit (PCNA family)
MLTLRPQFAAIAKAAARESTRYSINSVLVEECDGGRTSRAVATDGHMLAIMEAPNEAGEFPPIFPADTPNGQMAAIIPVDKFIAAFKKAPHGRIARIKPILASVAVQPSDTITSLGSTDLDGKTIETCAKPEQTFPPYQDLIPKATPMFRFRMNPDYLLTLVQMARGFSSEYQPGVVLEFWSETKPMVLRTQNDDAKFTGIVMPLNMPEGGPLGNDVAYTQWQRQVKASDQAFTVIKAVRQYIAGLSKRMPADLQALDIQCRQVLEAAGLTA